MSTQFIEIQKQEQMAEAIRRKKLEEELKAGQKKVAVQVVLMNLV
jgi:peptidyl-tRNA hydrolase